MRPKTLQLFFDAIHVADIEEPFCHQGTWFGSYCQLVNPASGNLSKRLYDYIVFCQDWHSRLKTDLPHDADAFSSFSDIVNSTKWYSVDADGVQIKFDHAPIFVEGEISWCVL